MHFRNIDLVVVGGGPAGLAAAINAKECGVDDLLVIERNKWLGGILPQCIHDGFGLEIFKQSLTGPEYAQRYIDEAKKLDVPCLVNSMALEITPEKNVIVSSPQGIFAFHAKAVILAMGCRERTRGQLRISGTRPAGVYTAGVAQNLLNLKNFLVGKNIVILGSGDIGLIMARRLTLEGAKVQAVIENLPYPSGLPRNIQQCLIDYDIPLLLSHTVTQIHGRNRVDSVTVTEVDENLEILQGADQKMFCDTLLLSVGLIPENELSKTCGITMSSTTNGPIVNETLETNVPGIFACGNVLHVHDVVDYVTLEAEKAGHSAAEYVSGQQMNIARIPVAAGKGIRYVLPQFTCRNTDIELSMRVTAPGINQSIGIRDDHELVTTRAFRKLHPAEMIKMPLTRDEITNAHELRVEVLPERRKR